MGHKTLTPASDVYSLGLVLYEMVTGQTPFQAETPLAVIHMQINEPLPAPRYLRPDLPEAAEMVILKALAKDPEQRYPSCGTLATAFAQAVTGQFAIPESTRIPAIGTTLPTYPGAGRIPPTTRQSSVVKRLPIWGWALAAVLVIGIIFTVGAFSGAGNREEALHTVAVIPGPAEPSPIPPTSAPAAVIPAATFTSLPPPDTAILTEPPTLVPPTVTAIILTSLASATPTFTPTLAGPTAAPVGWLPVRFLYNDDGFFWMNDSGQNIRVENIAFENFTSRKRFEGRQWAYYTMEQGRCHAIVFADVSSSRCPENRRPNAWFTPTRNQNYDFWTGGGQFHAFWRGIEIAVCDIAAGQCLAYVPDE
jgi:hypothetical protein